MTFKILSGFYRNMTYTINDVYELDLSKVMASDIEQFDRNKPFGFFEKINDDEFDIDRCFGNPVKVKAIFNGLSRIDNSPIFTIDKSCVREFNIESIVK